MNGFYWIYLLMLGLTLAWTLSDKKENRTRLYYFAWALLAVFYVAQDYSVSVDMPIYTTQYPILAALPWSQITTHPFEVGFIALNKLSALLFTSNRTLLLFCAALIMVPYCLYLEKESREPMLAMMCFLALGIYMHALIYMRQLIAMAIMTFSFRYIRERKPVPFFLLLIAAMCFHKSAVLLGILYFAYLLPIDRRLLTAAGIGAVAMALLGKPLLTFVISFIYPVYKEHPELLASEGGITMLVVLWIFVGLCLWLLGDKLKGELKLPFLMLLIAAVLQPVALTFYNWSRIVLYFRVSLIVLVPELYRAVMCDADNKLMNLVKKILPKLHGAIMKAYGKKWFHAAVQVLMFAVLFLWYRDEMDIAVYTLAPI